MVSTKQSLVNLSTFAGNRFDLVQAGGGNSSAKLDEHCMLIKASGISLAEVSTDAGYVSIDYSLIRKFIADKHFSSTDRKEREILAAQLMAESKLSSMGQPSIETFLHALLNTYTLHTHPISVNVLTAKENWQSELASIWPDAIFVAYHTPGIDLALALAEQIDHYQSLNGEKPKVIFLQNHGLIISSANPEEVIQLTDEVCMAIEDNLAMNLERYRHVSQIQRLFSQLNIENINILCNDDSVIQQQLNSENSHANIWPFCPDTLIYCGIKPVYLSSIADVSAIKNYLDTFNEIPKVLILNQQVYFCASSLKKAKDSQDLFRFHLIVRQHSKDNIQRLTLDEIAYLSNWDAEKYRQGV